MIVFLDIVKGAAHRRKREKEDIRSWYKEEKSKTDMKGERNYKESETFLKGFKTSSWGEIRIIPCKKNNGYQ